QYFDDNGAVGTQSSFGGGLVATDPIEENECTDTPVTQVDAPIGVCVVASTLAQVIDHAASAAGIGPDSDAVFFLIMPPGDGTGGCSAKGPPPTGPLTFAVLGKSGGEISAAFGGVVLTCPDPDGKARCRTVVRRGARVSVTAQPGANVVFNSWDKASPCIDK